MILTNIQADCLIPCPTCKAKKGKTCKNTGKPKDKLTRKKIIAIDIKIPIIVSPLLSFFLLKFPNANLK